MSCEENRGEAVASCPNKNAEEDEEKMPEVTARLAAVKEISVGAAVSSI